VATAYRDPTADESESGTWSGASAGTRYTLVDDYPDASGADYLTHGTTAGYLNLFPPSLFSLGSGATSISIQVLYYDQKTASQACAIAGRLKVGGGYYNAATHNPANGVWTSRTDNWATNPKSGVAWTPDDVNGVGANALQGMGFYSSDASPTIRLASIRLQVTYTPGVYTLTADAGSFSFAGVAAALLSMRRLDVGAASFAFTGSDVGLRRLFTLAAQPGAFSFAGAAAALLANRRVNVQPANFPLTGATAALLAKRLLAVDPASFSFTGADVTLTYTGGGGPPPAPPRAGRKHRALKRVRYLAGRL